MNPLPTAKTQEAKREEFPDGSAVVTYADGSVVILESKHARETTLQDARPASYSAPPPPAPQATQSSVPQ